MFARAAVRSAVDLGYPCRERRFEQAKKETHMTQSRFDKLHASLRTSGLDAVILNPGPTLTHLTGLHFHLMERPVVLLFAKDQDPAIVLPELQLQKVASLPYTLQVFAYSENPAEWDGAFRK